MAKAAESKKSGKPAKAAAAPKAVSKSAQKPAAKAAAKLGAPKKRVGRGLSFSQDVRERVLRALERGERPVDIVNRLEVSRPYVYKVKRMQALGLRTAKQRGGYKKPKLGEHHDEVLAYMTKNPEATLAELAAWVEKKLKITLSLSGLFAQLRRWKLSTKRKTKRTAKPPAKSAVGKA